MCKTDASIKHAIVSYLNNLNWINGQNKGHSLHKTPLIFLTSLMKLQRPVSRSIFVVVLKCKHWPVANFLLRVQYTTFWAWYHSSQPSSEKGGKFHVSLFHCNHSLCQFSYFRRIQKQNGSIKLNNVLQCIERGYNPGVTRIWDVFYDRRNIYIVYHSESQSYAHLNYLDFKNNK